MFHTFPLRSLLGARISGAGIGGRDIAALIPSPEAGAWSWEYLTFCSAAFFLGFVGVAGDPGVVRTSAVRTAPHLVCFSAQVMWWNFGEVEYSLGHFLDMAEVWVMQRWRQGRGVVKSCTKSGHHYHWLEISQFSHVYHYPIVFWSSNLHGITVINTWRQGHHYR